MSSSSKRSEATIDSCYTKDYYDELHRSVDELHSLEILATPSINYLCSTDEYTGVDEMSEWEPSYDGEIFEPEDYGLKTYWVWGEWTDDKSHFDGIFPVNLYADGHFNIMDYRNEWSYDEVHEQIRIAKKYNLEFGICANTFSRKHYINLESTIPNSLLFGSSELLIQLDETKCIRIDSNTVSAWTYAHIDYEDKIFKDKGKEFTINNSKLNRIKIEKFGIIPCYPTIVDGLRIQRINSAKNAMDGKALIYKTYNDLQISLEKSLPGKTIDTRTLPELANDDENIFNCCLTPEEDEEVFQQTLKAIEADRLQIARKPASTTLKTSNNEQIEYTKNRIQLIDVFPSEIAAALQWLSQYLPYDDISVAMAFITGAAGMIKLGTKVEGNIATRFQVPINFYTAIVAQSGRKKTPLQKIFVREPARKVLLEVASINNNNFQNWQEICRGKSKDEKPPKPVAIDVRISDYTAEALVIALRRLDELGLALLIERDEINGLFNSLNMYKGGKGADEQQLLELYDGGAYRSLRQSDSTRGFQRSAVNIFGAVQPEILFNLIASGDASGKWARFIFVPLPDKTIRLPDKLSDQEKAEIDQAENLLQQIIYTIYKHDCFNYKLSSEAIKLFSEYEHGKQRNVLDAKLSAQSSLYGKSAGKVLRMAGILHILWNYDNRNELYGEISTTILQKAICIVDHLDIWMLETHAKVAGAKSYNLDSFGKRIHDIALKSQLPMSWTEIRNQMSSTEKFKKTAIDAEKSMQALVEMNLGQISKGDRGGLCYKAIKPL